MSRISGHLWQMVTLLLMCDGFLKIANRPQYCIAKVLCHMEQNCKPAFSESEFSTGVMTQEVGLRLYHPSLRRRVPASQRQDFDKNLTALLLPHNCFCSIYLRQHFSWKCGFDFLFNIFLFKSFFILQSNPHVVGLQFQTLAFPIISVSKVSSSGWPYRSPFFCPMQVFSWLSFASYCLVWLIKRCSGRRGGGRQTISLRSIVRWVVRRRRPDKNKQLSKILFVSSVGCTRQTTFGAGDHKEWLDLLLWWPSPDQLDLFHGLL